jgi:hypothetical protein
MAAVTAFQIPHELKKFDLSFPCTEEQAKEAIVEIARQVAHVYARLLTPQGHQERGTDFFFFKLEDSPLPEQFPTAQQVENFEKQLAQAMVEKFQEPHGGVVRLSVHYRPEKILSDVMGKCGIDDTAFNLTRYFPCKMHTDIYFREDQQIIQVKQWDGI